MSALDYSDGRGVDRDQRAWIDGPKRFLRHEPH
jgi:hypothetical protein